MRSLRAQRTSTYDGEPPIVQVPHSRRLSRASLFLYFPLSFLSCNFLHGGLTRADASRGGRLRSRGISDPPQIVPLPEPSGSLLGVTLRTDFPPLSAGKLTDRLRLNKFFLPSPVC